MSTDLSRHKWPKVLPALTAEQQRISDDFVHHWHEVLPKHFGLVEVFNHSYPATAEPIPPNCRTLEIGAGIGAHLHYEDYEKQNYFCLELRENMAWEISQKFPSVETIIGDCQKRLSFDDGSFDRIVAIHVLEHLPDLPRAIDEMARLLTADGFINVVIPCDPGFIYSLARYISAARIFRRRYKQGYNWFIRREHINSPAEIIAQLERHFRIVKRRFFPFYLPLIPINLCLGLVARRK